MVAPLPRDGVTSLLLVALLLAAGCAPLAPQPAAPEAPEADPERLYRRAMAHVDAQACQQATPPLLALVKAYPESDYGARGMLALAYCELESGRAPAALALVRQVIARGEAHDRMDYALYLKARALLAHTPAPAHHQTVEALQTLGQLQQRFPASAFAEQGSQLHAATVALLAGRELEAARAHLAAERPDAALNRARYLIEQYPKAAAVGEALSIMSRAYLALGLEGMASSTAQIEQARSAATALSEER
ncbi:outer membrane protein assembly factor BamD [Motiliproteus sp. SC1-56]|uniref:outer membrane protein assembly factor BamD n=1 Tax=Motiliproteus sp. SC1-56 TaxID=2799565 RepID=UPI001A90CB12|nr:outer membrane protein assembly factor BamD [Motiliproteus sp. SC1-56]